MPMTTDDLAWVRADVGRNPTDDDLNARYDRIHGKAGVALEVWRSRLADFTASPASLGADGLSIGAGANIEAIQKRINKLEILARAEGSYVASLGSGHLHRNDREQGRFGDCPLESELYAEFQLGPLPPGGPI